MLLPKYERSLRVTHRPEDQHLNLPMLSGEIHLASRLQAPIPEVRLVAEGVSGRSMTNLGPLLVAVLIAGGSVTLLENVYYVYYVIYLFDMYWSLSSIKPLPCQLFLRWYVLESTLH